MLMYIELSMFPGSYPLWLFYGIVFVAITFSLSALPSRPGIPRAHLGDVRTPTMQTAPLHSKEKESELFEGFKAQCTQLKGESWHSQMPSFMKRLVVWYRGDALVLLRLMLQQEIFSAL